MKSVKNFICLILTSLLIFVLVGCNNKDNKDNKDAESAAKKYLNLYYNVDKADMEFYEKRALGLTDEKINETMDIYDKNSEKFKPLLTDRGYQGFVANRVTTGRIKEAYDKKCYVTVKDIKLQKYNEDKTQNMRAYTYYIEVNQASIGSNKITVDKKRNTIHVFKIKKVWKVE